MAKRDLCLQRAQQAVDSIGLGFDINQEICFDNFKRCPRLIQIDDEYCRDVNIPGGVSIPNVPNSIKCLGGESFRIQSEVLTFQQMSEYFNVGMRLTGKVPSGHFNASFGLSGAWNKDAATTKSLAYDGWFITRYAFELERCDGELHDHVKEAMPSSWDPAALARFIERFGTHVVVGVSMGGKDVLYIRQEDPSYVQPTSLLEFLKDKASIRFTDSAENHRLPSEVLYNSKENIVVTYNRRGGSNEVMRHSEWLQTVDSEPDIISVFLLPLYTLLGATPGIGYLTHAINVYVRHKPPIEELSWFFNFLLRRLWAPVHSETSLGSHWKNRVKSGLRLGILGPTLYINTIPVDVGNRPVTGLRLFLEGAESNRLAIHLQHVDSLPMGYHLSDDANSYLSCDPYSCNLHKKLIRWYGFSRVCTASVESDDSVSIVTGAQLHVARNCLLLRLRFSKVVGATLKKPPEWDQYQSLDLLKKSTVISVLSTTTTTRGRGDHPKPGDVTIGSAVYAAGPPVPVITPKLQKFVDSWEMVRGPQDTPGYWAVSGAGLSVQYGKITLRVKYSLLSFDN